MNRPSPGKPGTAPPPAPEEPRSGEGAETALEALIRRRRQVQLPDDAPPPEPPPGA